MQVLLGVSNRHVHLTEEDYHILFGDSPLEVVKNLVQKNQFASNQFVTIQVEDRKLERVRVLGPLRDYTQDELSETDARFLKIAPPIRTSGDLEGAIEVTIIGTEGSIKKPCAILANRHIHMNHETREKLGLLEVSKVSVFFKSEKMTTFHDVFIKEQADGVLELHLDTDDANGALLKTGDMGTICIEQ